MENSPQTETVDISAKETAKKKILLAVYIVVGILLLDQAVKFVVKTNMMLNTQFPVFGDWFYIHFTENPGMAFGLSFGGDWGKLALTFFRIIAVTGIGWYIWDQVKEGASKGFVICLAMIFAGAMGNIIDSIFYGKIFSDSHYQIAEFLPEEGYAGWFHGRVVDMFYFPIIRGHYPEFLGGGEFIFFRPIFNIADTFISIGVICILLFQARLFKHARKDKAEQEAAAETGTVSQANENPDKEADNNYTSAS